MAADKKSRRIVFLSNAKEADEYLLNNPVIGDGELFISMSPSVQAHLKRKGISSENTLIYFTNESHKKALEKSNELVKWLEKSLEFSDLGLGVKSAYKDFFIYWTRFSIHYCIWVTEIATNAIKSHNPYEVCAYFGKNSYIKSFYIGDSENYFGFMVSEAAKSKNIRFINLSGGNSEKRFLNSPSISLHMGDGAKFILNRLRFWFWEKTIIFKRIFTKTRPVFITTNLYQMDKLAERLKKDNPDRPFFMLGGPVVSDFPLDGITIFALTGKYAHFIIDQKRLFGQLVSKIKDEDELFSFNGVSFSRVIANKVNDNITDYIIGMMVWTIKLNSFIKKANPVAFISNANRADDIVIAELCGQVDIPTVLISHGSHVRPKNDYEKIEWGELARAFIRAPFSHLALQSTLSEGFLETFPSKSRLLKTGPLIWGKSVDRQRSRLLFNKMFNGRFASKGLKVVVHAGTSKPTNSLRLHVYETPDEYIQALFELSKAIEEIPGVALVIKFRQFPGISVEDLKTLVPFSSKVILSVNESFLDILGMADLLVSFSSTTIEEALQNRIPVLLYGGNGRYSHVPAYEIEPTHPVQQSAVYHLKETKNLEYAISKILELNISGNDKDRYLFDQYIYDRNDREPLDSILNI